MAPSPVSKQQPQPCIIVCPPERHISVAFDEIFSIARKTMSLGQRQRYEEVCKLLESLYSQEFMGMRRSIKHNFLMFSVGAKGQQLATRKNRGLPPQADLVIREEKLLADLLQLMAAARFHLLSKKDWEKATSERFMFRLPVKVNWDFFDTGFLSRFWDSTPARRKLRACLPEHADRVLVLTRGIGVAQEKSLYINEKIDLLVEYIVVNPLKAAWLWVRRVVVLRKQTTGAKTDPSSPTATRTASNLANATMHSTGPVPRQSMGGTPVEDEQPQHRATKTVERRTIPRMLPTVLDVIKNFHKPIDLQEPMYKEVVVVYRTGRAGGRNQKVSGPVRARTTAQRMKDILMKRNIHVKCFHDIPMADLEVIFPDKKVYLKNVSLISMIIQAVLAFVAAVTGLWKAGGLNFQAIWSALSLVAARCGQLYSSMQAERSKMIQDMVNVLYDKTQDAQEGVLSMLLEDMAEQQLKEAVLAYTMLYLNIEDEMSQDELDNLCERFLEENFDLLLDFAVEDALPRLVQWGMVKYNAKSDRYQALPVEDAYVALTGHWQQAYEALSKPPNQPLLPLTALLSGGDRTPSQNGGEGLASIAEIDPETGAPMQPVIFMPAKAPPVEYTKSSKKSSFRTIFSKKRKSKTA